MSDSTIVPLDDLILDARVRLEDLVEREALEELCGSFHKLFGIPVRIYSAAGALLADAWAEHELCAYVNGVSAGRRACESTVGQARSREPTDAGDVTHTCFTGAAYRITPLEYDARRVGRIVIGPFLPASVVDVPASLLAIDSVMDAGRAQPLLAKMPRAKPETVTRLASHLKSALDLILFSGHKAYLTSHMHLASVRESYRQLERQNERLQQALDRAKELDRLKSSFLATVSHELHTPLTSIIGYSEMLLEGLAGDMKAEQADFVKTIHDKGNQLLSLITGLLDSSKLESGTMRMTMRTVRVEPVLGEVVSTLAPAARKKKVSLVQEVAGDLLELRGDPERLRQVFLNLVENAIKFTPVGGTVTLRARMMRDTLSDEEQEGFALLAPARTRVEVRVVDTGIGIADHEKPKVFDAFYQVDSSSTREHGGTGLGLSIVKRLVEAHSGKIRIEDNAPTGTQFVVVFPPPLPAE